MAAGGWLAMGLEDTPVNAVRPPEIAVLSEIIGEPDQVAPGEKQASQ